MKRAVAIIVVFLLLGAIVNVAVAWTIVVRDFDASDPKCFIEAPSDKPSRLANVALCWMSSRVSVRYDIYTPAAFGVFVGSPHVSNLAATVPRWASRFLGEEEVSTDQWRYRKVFASGWPALSMCGSVYFDEWPRDPSMIRTEWALVGPPPPPQQTVESRIIPLRPILPGFIINTLFYALLLWLLFLAPFAAQRMIRRRRGQCEKCAYPIGVSPVCTECGAAVAPKHSMTEPRA